ncbi:MAG: hypothetical protein IPP94_01515 [Ignavibacteria bacterium]|nr:hypothetical protein [Ignavibacteria bacterium]
MKTGRYGFAYTAVLFLALATASAAPWTEDPPVAMVTSVTGKAVAMTAAKEEAIVVGAELRQGSVVKVQAGSASVVFLQGDFIELKMGEQLTLGKDLASSALNDNGATRGVTKEDAVKVSENGIPPQQGRDYLSQLAVVSGIRGDKMAVPVSPRLALSETAPVFYWFDTDSAAAGAKRAYTIMVRDQNDRIVFQKNAEGAVYEMNQASFDNLAASLKASPEKRFTWAVFEDGKVPNPLPKFDAMFVYVDSLGFRAAGEKREQMQSLLAAKKMDEQSFHTLLALYYTDDRERLFADAIPHLEWLAATPSGRGFALEQMARILPRFGNQVSVVAARYAAQLRDRPAK